MSQVFPKIGLALGSGGARGLAHIGVIQVLEKHDIPIHVIAGSSIGALIGAQYAVHKDSKLLEDVALSFNRRKGFALFDPTISGGLLKGEKIQRLIEDVLHGATFEGLQIPFAAVATDFLTAAPVILRQGNLIQAVRASVSIPGIFQPLHIKKRVLADGGLSNPVPVDIVRALGADIVIAVNLDTVYADQERDKIPSLPKIPLHAINILRHHLALHSAKTAHVVLSPNVHYVGLVGWNYFFNTEKAKKIIQEGRKSTEESLPHIHQAIHSFTNSQSESFLKLMIKRVLRR
jgi:NTE family protein